MKKDEFRTRVFEIAREQGRPIDTMQKSGVERIWFNLKSKKYLHADHIDRLFPLLRTPGLDRRTINAEIDRVAPGKNCTHRGMREIYELLHKTTQA